LFKLIKKNSWSLKTKRKNKLKNALPKNTNNIKNRKFSQSLNRPSVLGEQVVVCERAQLSSPLHSSQRLLARKAACCGSFVHSDHLAEEIEIKA